MDLSTILSIVANAAVVLMGYVLARKDKEIDDLRKAFATLPETYARRDDLGTLAVRIEKLGEAIFLRFDRIEDKLDKKADKP